jgi:hypothetical protein
MGMRPGNNRRLMQWLSAAHRRSPAARACDIQASDGLSPGRMSHPRQWARGGTAQSATGAHESPETGLFVARGRRVAHRRCDIGGPDEVSRGPMSLFARLPDSAARTRLEISSLVRPKIHSSGFTHPGCTTKSTRVDFSTATRHKIHSSGFSEAESCQKSTRVGSCSAVRQKVPLEWILRPCELKKSTRVDCAAPCVRKFHSSGLRRE